MEISAVKLRQDLFKILNKVNETHTEITITKRGKPVAKIVHVNDRNNFEDPLIGIMKGCGKTLGDLVQPVIDPTDWEID
ncbi:MAG: type II toxin-antitoxin system Phd/YefM family antitoxin [Desulfobacterales bacterium]